MVTVPLDKPGRGWGSHLHLGGLHHGCRLRDHLPRPKAARLRWWRHLHRRGLLLSRLLSRLLLVGVLRRDRRRILHTWGGCRLLRSLLRGHLRGHPHVRLLLGVCLQWKISISLCMKET